MVRLQDHTKEFVYFTYLRRSVFFSVDVIFPEVYHRKTVQDFLPRNGQPLISKREWKIINIHTYTHTYKSSFFKWYSLLLSKLILCQTYWIVYYMYVFSLFSFQNTLQWMYAYINFNVVYYCLLCFQLTHFLPRSPHGDPGFPRS